MRSETANNLTNIDGQLAQVDARVSKTEQNISTIYVDNLDLKQNVDAMSLNITNLNYSVTGLDQDVSMRLNTLNMTQVSIQSVFPCARQLSIHDTFLTLFILSGKHFQ